MAENEMPVEETGAIAEAEAPTGSEPSPKRPRSKKLMVLGIVVGVSVVCAIGFSVWHETPGF